MIFSITAFLLTVLLLGTYTFFSLRRDGWRKYVGPCGFGVVLITSLFGFLQTIGGCTPSWMAIGTKMDILAIAYDEPRAVYLWGVQAGKPRCVTLPWEEGEAKKIRAAEGEGGPLEYVWGTGPETEGALHPKPQEPLPPKDSHAP